MANAPMPFEQTIVELRMKIKDLKIFSVKNHIDLTNEILLLEKEAEKLEKNIYQNLTAWEKIQIARNAARPTTLYYIQQLFTDFVELHGDRLYGDDPAIIAGIAKFREHSVTVIGHERGRDTKDKIARNFGLPNPEGYRKALRLMKQADKFRRPIICFIDTQGAYPGVEAEKRGQSEAIARNLLEMAGFRVPIICIVIGEGGSGGALGIGVGNRLLMMEHAYYSVISPEGAAAILWKDANKAQQAAEALKITAQDLLDLGIIDRIVPEPSGGAHRDPELAARNLDKALWNELHPLLDWTEESLVADRFHKFSTIGAYKNISS